MDRRSFSSSRNSGPLSVVMLLNISRKFFMVRSSRSKTARTVAALRSGNLKISSRRVSRSVRVSRQARVPALPMMRSISQYPRSSLRPINHGRSAMLGSAGWAILRSVCFFFFFLLFCHKC